jgi:hypothetical protein
VRYFAFSSYCMTPKMMPAGSARYGGALPVELSLDLLLEPTGLLDELVDARHWGIHADRSHRDAQGPRWGRVGVPATHGRIVARR